MNLGVRTRVGVWLLLVVSVVAGAGFILLGLTESRLEQSAEDSLVQLVELERGRLMAELDDQRADVKRIAGDTDLLASMTADTADYSGANLDADEILERLLTKTQRAGQEFDALRVFERDGSLFGQTQLASVETSDLVAEAMDRRSIVVGQASEEARLKLISPVVSPMGEVLGALVIEAELTPITWLSGRYESLGDTSEAFVYQRRSDGSCQLLTDLRFERSAAFSTIDGDFGAACGELNESRLFRGADYRGVQTLSAWSSVPDTTWGIVVKMDDQEVFGLLYAIRRTIVVAGSVAAVILLIGWLVLVRSIGTRLARAASTAEQLASGNFDASITDHRSDEIGRMTESISRLATDLADDIERREMAEANLRARADFDELTGLMNRSTMMAQLTELSAAGQEFLIVFLDLDGFKEINDTYGHSIGDEVLRQVAARVHASIDLERWAGDFGRWGGDEFVVLCPGASEAEAASLVDVIDRQFDDPFRTDAGEHRVGVSIGTADTAHARTVEAVMSAADASMYRMKRRGDGRSRVSPQSIKFVEDALESQRVLAFLQPCVRIDAEGSAHLAGAEALVRVRHKDGSLVDPASVLPGLGASEQALALDLRVLEGAVASAAEWHRSSVVPPDFYVSANLGASAMADPRLVDKVMAIIRAQGLAPRNFVVEIPETAHEVDVATIEQLRSLGVRVAVDDVGCQFSNLERLVDIPADIAKIDRRWLPNSDPHGSSKLDLLTGLVEQCRMLDLTVVVEGIETDEQLELVRSIGIEQIQGFLFGRPVPPAHFERLWARPGGRSLRTITKDETETPGAARAVVG